MQIIDGTADELKLLLSLVRRLPIQLCLSSHSSAVESVPSPGPAQAVVCRLPGGLPAEATRVERQGQAVYDASFLNSKDFVLVTNTARTDILTRHPCASQEHPIIFYVNVSVTMTVARGHGLLRFMQAPTPVPRNFANPS